MINQFFYVINFFFLGEAPPPGSYDPKFDTKIKSFTIEKKERFNDNRSVASSGGDCSKSVSSSRDVAPIPSPKFRTVSAENIVARKYFFCQEKY